MQTIEENIEVHVPARTAYEQWKRVEEFPEFMEDVQEVRDLGGNRQHWTVEIGGKRMEWDSEVAEDVPGERISWRSTSGKQNEGAVSFHPLSEHVTRVSVRFSYETEGVLEGMANAVGLLQSQVQADLGRFKQLVESRNQEERERRVDAAAQPSSETASMPRSKRLNEELAKQFSNAKPASTPSSAPGKM